MNVSAVFCWIVKYCWRQKTYCFFKKWHIYIYTHTCVYIYTFICAFITDNIKFNKYLNLKNADSCYVSLHSSGAMAVSQTTLPMVTNTTHGLQWLHHLNIETKQEATALMCVFNKAPKRRIFNCSKKCGHPFAHDRPSLSPLTLPPGPRHPCGPWRGVACPAGFVRPRANPTKLIVIACEINSSTQANWFLAWVVPALHWLAPSQRWGREMLNIILSLK